MTLKSALSTLALAASLPLSILVVTPASAAMPTTSGGSRASLVEVVRSDCTWVDNKWTYKKGDKRLVCRPNRPSGKGWSWHSEGKRQGWYHGQRKAWHNLTW